MDTKITLPYMTAPAIKMLARGKRLRDTPLDPFGRAELRRIERSLPGEYLDGIERVRAHLSPQTHAAAVAIANLSNMVVGYEHIKAANVERFRRELQLAIAAMTDARP